MKIDYIKKERAIKMISEGWKITQKHSYYTSNKGRTMHSSWPYYLVHDDFVTEHRIHHSTVSVIQKIES